MYEIMLTRGFITTVSDVDYEYLSQWSWYAAQNKRSPEYVSAQRRTRVPGDWKKKITVHMHRLVMERVLNRPLESHETVDHINHDGHKALDNRRENLRLATKQQQQYNTGANKTAISEYKGVVWHKLVTIEKLSVWGIFQMRLMLQKLMTHGRQNCMANMHEQTLEE